MQYRDDMPRTATVLALYDACGWTAYTKDPTSLIQGLAQSLDVRYVMEGEKLVGLIRAVGDGATILYIQDLLVHPDWRRQGIATGLVQDLLTRYKDVRQIVLTTDDDPAVRAFYDTLGFVPYDQLQLVGYYHKKGA